MSHRSVLERKHVGDTKVAKPHVWRMDHEIALCQNLVERARRKPSGIEGHTRSGNGEKRACNMKVRRQRALCLRRLLSLGSALGLPPWSRLSEKSPCEFFFIGVSLKQATDFLLAGAPGNDRSWLFCPLWFDPSFHCDTCAFWGSHCQC